VKKALKIARRIFFWIFFIGLFLTTVVTVILYVYEDDIKQYAIDEMNEYLKTEFQAEDISLSFFHDFPFASIEFKNVFIADSYPEIESKDTLLYAERMFFNFNVMDIYSGNYKVKRISLHHGGLFLKTAEDGQTNFDIIKKKEENSSEEQKFEFLLELLEVDDFELRYRNIAAQQFYDLSILQGLFQGDFSEESFLISSESNLFINRLKSNSFTLVKEKIAHLNMDLAVNSVQDSYTFSRGDLEIEKMAFRVTGRIDSASVDLKISGDEIQLNDLANSLVDESVEDVKNYEGTGIINFVSHIHGPISSLSMPVIDADFDITNGSITDPESKLTITDVSFQGRYGNAQSDREEQLSFENVKLKMLESYFNGTASITNFSQPLLEAKMDGNIDLGKFHQFFKFENIEKLSGSTSFQCSAKVRFFDPEYDTKTFDVLESEGTFSLNKIQFKSTLQELYYHEISGELVLNDKDAAAKELQIRTAKSDVLINGAMMNLMPFLDGTGNLGLVASIESKNIDLGELLKGSEAEENDALQVFTLPANLNLNVDLGVENLNWENHNFQEITGKLLMSNREVNLNKFFMRTLGGEVFGNLNFTNRMENGNLIDGRLYFSGVNVNKLFKEWNNFGQSNITDNNLTGNVNGDVDLLLSFNPYFSLIDEQLFAKCNLEIKEGELNDVETLKSVTEYMRSNKTLKLLLNKHIDKFEQKLLNLQFSNLRNEITIKDRRITIPKMRIETNALDIDLFGWHDFDNQIEYHFSFRFRELKQKATENEFGIIEDDGLGLVVYLTMYGDLDNPSFELDGDARRKSFKDKLKEEKHDLKAILKSEMGFFKKDTTIQKIEKNNRNEIQFIIYDADQENSSDTVRTKKKKNKKHTGKLFDKWKQQADQKKNKIDYKEEN
jgi:AsmA-like C-terminal region